MTMTEAYVENLSDRVIFQKVPQALPGSCGICGVGGDPDGYADPQLFFEFHGALFFCRKCTIQLGAVFGLIAPEIYEDMIGELATTQLHLSDAQSRIRSLEDVVDSYNRMWSNYRLSSPDNLQTPEQISASETSPAEPVIRTESKSVELVDSTDREPSEKSGETPESSGKPGLFHI